MAEVWADDAPVSGGLNEGDDHMTRERRLTVLAGLLLALLPTLASAGDMPGYDDMVYQGGYADQMQAVPMQQGGSLQPFDSKDMTGSYGQYQADPWQGSPVAPFGTKDAGSMYQLEPVKGADFSQSGDFAGGSYDPYGQYGQTGSSTQFGLSLQIGQSGQYGQYGMQNNGQAGFWNPGSQGVAFDSSDPLRGLEDENLFGDYTSWLPTLEQRWSMTPDQLKEYDKQISDYRKRLADDLKNNQAQEADRMKQEDRNLKEARSAEDRQFAEYMRQQQAQWKEQDARLKEQQRQMRERASEEDRRLSDAARTADPAEIAAAREELRLRRMSEDQQMREAAEQMAQQRKDQDAQAKLEVERRKTLREQEDRQRKIQQVAWELRYRLAVLALKGPPIRDRLNPPSFDTGGKLVSERYIGFKKEHMVMWTEQQKQEEARISEVFKARQAVGKIGLDQQKYDMRRSNDWSESVGKEQQRRAVEQRKAALQRAAFERALRREQAKARTRINDIRFREWQKQARASGQAIDVEQVRRYQEEVRARAQQEEAAFKEEERQAKAAAEAEDRALAEQARQRDFQTAERRRAIDAQMRNMDDQAKAQDKAQVDRMRAWVDSRKVMQKQVGDAFNAFVKAQSELKRRYDSYMSSTPTAATPGVRLPSAGDLGGEW